APPGDTAPPVPSLPVTPRARAGAETLGRAPAIPPDCPIRAPRRPERPHILRESVPARATPVPALRRPGAGRPDPTPVLDRERSQARLLEGLSRSTVG